MAEAEKDFELEFENEEEIENESDEDQVKGDQEEEEEDEDTPDDLKDDEEYRNYSKNVQKRIKQLTFERHEERRKAEEARRMQEEAVEFARRQHEELSRLRKQYTDGQGVLYEQAKGRVEAQMMAAQRELKDAYEEGDPDKIVEAQTKLAEISSEKSRLSGYAPRKDAQPQQAQNYQPPRQAQKRQVHPRAQKWASENTWFQRDSKMTAYAFGVHEDLIKSGVQPDTEEYYGQLDREMRKVFPSHFGIKEDAGNNAQATVVAPPTRKSARKPRTVKLTQTQVALCKRLGITPEQYAEQLIEEGKKNG